jgi:hypothetical protein
MPSERASPGEASPTPAGSARLREDLRRHAVALISLFVALTGLGYNTWRNESTEAHRNIRQAAFVMLEQLGELQQVVDQRYYAGKANDINRIQGWGKIALVRDMSMLISADTSREASRLYGVWRNQLERMDTGDPEAERQISRAIMATREQVLRDLEALH